MIRKITKEDIKECVRVITESFMTVADELGFTKENAPRFTAFATTEERLMYHLEVEKRPMYGFFSDEGSDGGSDNGSSGFGNGSGDGSADNAGSGQLLGYYSLAKQSETEWELNNLCVLPKCRHDGIGDVLLQDAFAKVKELGGTKMNIGIVEENKRLRSWYESKGFVHTGTKKFDFFPFTCGYMEKQL
ncbi:MAG: GNAT family N-acetyltransferase [Clostridiales bacterium]|nr:GNAT family N-acetyltransferase [Clostridiales bacterium]